MFDPRGLLMVWTNIPGELEDDFNEWHNREHMPERILDLDGFERGRRFVACDGGPRYLDVRGVVSAWYAERNDEAVAMACTMWARCNARSDALGYRHCDLPASADVFL